MSNIAWSEYTIAMPHKGDNISELLKAKPLLEKLSKEPHYEPWEFSADLECDDPHFTITADERNSANPYVIRDYLRNNGIFDVEVFTWEFICEEGFLACDDIEKRFYKFDYAIDMWDNSDILLIDADWYDFRTEEELLEYINQHSKMQFGTLDEFREWFEDDQDIGRIRVMERSQNWY